LSELFKAVGLFEMEHRVPGEGKPPVIYVRDARHHHRAGPAA
jgi:hypothetical protein